MLGRSISSINGEGDNIERYVLGVMKFYRTKYTHTNKFNEAGVISDQWVALI